MSRVRQVHPTPLRGGMVVLYESQSENLLRFSKNKVETNKENDFQTLG